MAQTYFGTALRSGSTALTDTVDGGYVVLSQTTTVATIAAGTATSATITIPAYSQIIDLVVDMVTVPSYGTATKVDATIGTAAAGTQYLSATDVSLVGRTALAFTSAQLTSMSNVGTNQSVVITVDPNGTVATQGTFRLTVIYAQTV